MSEYNKEESTFEKLQKTLYQEDKNELYLESIKQKVLTLYVNTKPNQATEEMTNYIKNNYYIKSIRNDDKDEIYIYKQGIYISEGKSYIKEIIRKILGDAFSNYKCNQVIEKIKVDTYIDQDKFFNQQNENPYLIPIQDGILNIKTKDIALFSPEYYFFNKLPIKFNHKKDCTKIKQFIKSILPKKRKVLFLTIKELFVYSM